MKPHRDFILCEIIKEDRGGLVVARDATDSEQRGRVLEVGPGRYEYGFFVPNTLKPGQIVTWNKFAERDFILQRDGKEVTLIRESQVLATEEAE